MNAVPVGSNNRQERREDNMVDAFDGSPMSSGSPSAMQRFSKREESS